MSRDVWNLFLRALLGNAFSGNSEDRAMSIMFKFSAQNKLSTACHEIMNHLPKNRRCR